MAASTTARRNWALKSLWRRGRIGLWHDQDGDGRLDFMIVNGKRPDGRHSETQLLRWREGGFQVEPIYPKRLRKRGGRQLLLADEIVEVGVARPLATLEHRHSKNSLSWLAPNPRRVVQADLDGDAELDYLVYGGEKIDDGICHVRGKNNSLLVHIGKTGETGPRDFSFATTGPVKLSTRNMANFASYAGDTEILDEFKSQVLSRSNKAFQGTEAAQLPGSAISVFYAADSERWTIRVFQEDDNQNTVQFVLVPLADETTIATATPACTAAPALTPYWLAHGDQTKRPLQIHNRGEPLRLMALAPGEILTTTATSICTPGAVPRCKTWPTGCC